MSGARGMTGGRRLRLGLWALAALLAGVAAADPRITTRAETLRVMAVVDITRSMTVRDMPGPAGQGGEARLAFLRRVLPELAARLPCGSELGIGVFAARRAVALIPPVETCTSGAAISGVVSGLDWRMGWDGDSRIADGLADARALALWAGADLLFLTDGHEAPPLPWTEREGASGAPGEGDAAPAGLIAGIGGAAPTGIPAYDLEGREAGLLGPADVPQEARTGPPPPGAETRPGYHPRNNPYGRMPAGSEHLSQRQDAHLGALAAATGLGYAAPQDAAALDRALRAHAQTRHGSAPLSLAPAAAGLALGLVAGLHLWPDRGALRGWLRRRRSSRRLTLRPRPRPSPGAR